MVGYMSTRCSTRIEGNHGPGLFLMRQLMDRVRISRSGRRVTLVKRLRS
jgi:anti-sigma regulatory factor (Ser/Thr protein kinase)